MVVFVLGKPLQLLAFLRVRSDGGDIGINRCAVQFVLPHSAQVRCILYVCLCHLNPTF